jgi:hypothetical protein
VTKRARPARSKTAPVGRNEALPRIAALADQERFADAFALAREAERYIAGDAALPIVSQVGRLPI